MEDICWNDYLTDSLDHEDTSFCRSNELNELNAQNTQVPHPETKTYPKFFNIFELPNEALFPTEALLPNEALHPIEEWHFDHQDPSDHLPVSQYFINSDSYAELGASDIQAKTVLGMPSNQKSLDPNAPKTRRAHCADLCLTVRAWLRLHAENPYPTTEQKEEFARSWDLSLKQVSNLFNNERRRSKWGSLSTAYSISGNKSSLTVSSIGAADFCMEERPIDRYLSSSPDEDPHTSESVASAAASFAWDLLVAERRNGSMEILNPQSTSILQDENKIENSSISDVSSTNDSSGQVSSAGSNYRSGKRGKRKMTIIWRPTHNEGRYYCTHCWKNFTSEASWRKHEETVHRPKKQFECRMAELVPTLQSCGACMDPRPGCRFSLRHNYRGCQERSREARTFNRRDHFRNHLKLSHDAEFTATMESWVQCSDQKKSRCGYCHKWFLSWTERLDHIGHHYRSGSGFDRSKWQQNYTDKDENPEFRQTLEPEDGETRDKSILLTHREQIHLKTEISSFLDSYLGQKVSQTPLGSSMFFMGWHEGWNMLPGCRPQHSLSVIGTGSRDIWNHDGIYLSTHDKFLELQGRGKNDDSELSTQTIAHMGGWI